MPQKKTSSPTPAPTTTSEEIATEVVKKKRSSPNGNGAVTFGNNGELFKDEEEKGQFIRKALTEALEYYNNKPVKDDAEAEERLVGYFKRCAERQIKPTVEEMALCLGVTVQTLWEWETGRKSTRISSEIVKKAKSFISIFDAKSVAEGKLNPVVYIFRSKNYYGMKDQQDVVITPNNPLGDAESAKQIEQKYAESVIDTTATTVEEN